MTVRRHFRPGDVVLVVDDDAGIRRLLDLELHRMGCGTILAANVSEAIAVLEQDRVDAILSDYAMPRGTGLNLLAYVRARGLELPFVLMSASLPVDAADAAVAAGVPVVDKGDLVVSLARAA